MKVPNWYIKPDYIKNIDEALEEVQVAGPGMWQNDLSNTILKNWYAVSTGEDHIIAYFSEERDALSFRLKIIDRWFNG